jgi:actin, other eukaryote
VSSISRQTLSIQWIGHIVPDGIRRVDLAGRDLTETLIHLLAERGYAFTTTMDHEIVRDIKEKLGYVALEYEHELKISPSSRHAEKTYKLPDGQEIKIGHERFRCAEALFAPRKFGYDECGVVDLLQSAVMKCNVHIHRDLYSNIILAGGECSHLR